MPSLFPIARSAWRLADRDRFAAARALLWLLAARLAVRLLSYATIKRLTARLTGRGAPAALSVDECALALRRALRVLPGSGCLPQAIAADCLLRREGHDPRIVFGVALDGAGRLDAHAWVQHQGRTVIGGEAAETYRPLTPPRAS